MPKRVRLRSKPDIQAAAGGKVPTFSMVAYNGGPMYVDGYEDPIVIDLRGLEAAPSVVANLNHESTDPVGHVTAIDNDGTRLVLAGSLSYASESRDQVVESATAGGFPFQASVEVSPDKLERLPAGQQATVNGQTITGPAIIARTGYLYGVAFVPRGADESTSVRIAASAARIRGAISMSFEDWLKSLGVVMESLSAEQMDAYKAAYAALQGAAPAAPAANAEMKQEDTVQAEYKNDTMQAGAAWDAVDIRAAHSDALDSLDNDLLSIEDDAPAAILAEAKKTARKALGDLKAKAARNRLSADTYRAKAGEIIAKAQLAIVRGSRPSAPAIHASQRDVNGDVIAAAVCQRLRLQNIDKAFDEKTLDAAHREFGGRLGIQQLLIRAAAANGMTLRAGDRIHTGNVREVLEYALPRRDIRASSGFSTLSLPGILSNIANKELLEGYMQEDNAWTEIAAIKSVPDFKQVTSYRMLDDMAYEELPKGGRIKHATTGEQSFTRQVRTYAKMYSITREDIINDDLGAFDALRDVIGRGAAMKMNDVFWTKFLDNATFFTSGNSNYIEGATTNLGTDGVGLSLGVKKFREMRSPSADGQKRIGGPPPTILLVPPELEAVAEALYTARNSAAVKVSETNIHAGKYRPVVVPWLSDSAYSGYSSTAWYLFRAPNSAMAPIVVSFLDGVQTPTVETADADFDQLGIQFRGYHDFGVDKFETLAGIKSKGAG
jgi:hypothetical protein